MVTLKAFGKFENTTDALAAATSLVDSKLSKGGCTSEYNLSALTLLWKVPGVGIGGSHGDNAVSSTITLELVNDPATQCQAICHVIFHPVPFVMA